MSCLAKNKALANQQKQDRSVKAKNISGSNKITEIINVITNNTLV